jgi:hypothetical protein
MFIKDGPTDADAEGEGVGERGSGGGRCLIALTETLQRIDLTDNFISEDVGVELAEAGYAGGDAGKGVQCFVLSGC